jgi:preprotein translocase subunit SecG
MLYYVIVTLYVIVSLLLLVVVLLQQGKGGDIAAAFGGSSSQTAFGARSGATVLTRATTVLGTLFLVGALCLTLIGREHSGSVVSGVGGTPPAATPPSNVPAVPMTLPTTK